MVVKIVRYFKIKACIMLHVTASINCIRGNFAKIFLLSKLSTGTNKYFFIDGPLTGKNASKMTKFFCGIGHKTHTQLFNSSFSGTTWVGCYQKIHSLTHSHPSSSLTILYQLPLLRSIPFSLFGHKNLT